jgi:hypothetical protein
LIDFQLAIDEDGGKMPRGKVGINVRWLVFLWNFCAAMLMKGAQKNADCIKIFSHRAENRFS